MHGSKDNNFICTSRMRHERLVIRLQLLTLDSAIHWINHYPLDNSIDFASVYQAPVVQMMDSAVHRINHCPADKH